MLKKATWKPVQIEGSLLYKGAEDLIGIEECIDYEFNSDFNNSKQGSKRKKPTKQKLLKRKKIDTNIVDPINGCISSENLTPSKSGGTIKINTETFNLNKSKLELNAWAAFNLPESILNALSDLGFAEPTTIQSLTLPAAILGKKDILGAAETGSGKTLAFGLPILTGILRIKEKENNNLEESINVSNSDSEDSDFETEIEGSETGCIKSVNIGNGVTSKPLYALILTPTRELAMQIKNHLTAVAKYTGINVATVFGGLAAVKQERILSKGPEIVVATPGRLWELIQQGNSHLSQIDNIKYLAIDETDRMLEKGHFQELTDLLEKLNFDETKRKQRQNFVFSATLTLVHELPKHLKQKNKLRRFKNIEDMTAVQKLQKITQTLGITNPKIVDITEGKGTSETLTECRITCSIDEKDYYLYYFLKRHPGRTLIFCNSIGCVKRLATLLTLLDCHPLPLHASMQQKQRLKNLERFRDTENSILVATDVAARGLDIPSIEHVIHYQTPRTSESYVHRSGRTARASKQGITILLIEPNELPNYIRLCRTLDKNEDIPSFPVQQNYLNAVKQRVNLARELDKLQLHVKKTNSEVGWFQKAAEDMDIIVDDFTRNFDTQEASQAKKAADIKRKQLVSLLAKPLFSKGLIGLYGSTPDMLLTNGQPKEENAIEVMKTAMKENKQQKKKIISLYKPNKHKIHRKSKAVASNLKQKNIKKKKGFRKFKRQ